MPTPGWEYKVGTSWIQGPSDMDGCLPYEDGSQQEPLTNPVLGIDENEDPLCDTTPCQCEKTDRDNVDSICKKLFTESWLDECLAIKDPSKVIQYFFIYILGSLQSFEVFFCQSKQG